MDKDGTPPTLHDLERLPKMDKGWTPPNPSPSRFREAPKWTRIGPPTLHDLERLLQKVAPGPPQPFTIWSGSQMDKDWTPPTLHDLEWLPNGQGLDPHTKPSPSSGTRQHSLTESPLLLPAPARTASQKAHMRTRQHSLTESPIQNRDRLAESTHAVLLVSSQFPPAQPHRKLTASSGIGQDSLTESPHENPPTKPHRKPNPDRDRLTESTHAVLLVSSQFPPAQPHRLDCPLLLPASARTAFQKAT